MIQTKSLAFIDGLSSESRATIIDDKMLCIYDLAEVTINA